MMTVIKCRTPQNDVYKSCSLIWLTYSSYIMLNDMQVLKKRVCYSLINRNLNASLIQCWPVISAWIHIPKLSILNHNIMYEPTKTTSLLAFLSFVIMAEGYCWYKRIWIIKSMNGTGYYFEDTCSSNSPLNAKDKLCITVDYIRSCHTSILFFYKLTKVDKLWCSSCPIWIISFLLIWDTW